MEQKIDNYQIQAQRARQRFLTYDQQQIIAKSPLTFDDDYLYLPVLDRTCMIRRQTGELFWQAGGVCTPSHDPSDAMTIFDYLCDSRRDRCLSGEFIAMANFGHQFHSGLLESGAPSALERRADQDLPDLCDSRRDRCLSGEFIAMANFGHQFHSGLLESGAPSALERRADQDLPEFCRVCRALGGEPVIGGDAGFQLRFFPDLPVVLRFWASDEEFPAQLRFYWDKNTLFYLRYETMYYALGILQSRLLYLINQV